MNNWYKELNRAPWTPPDYVFGIVWSILYTLMTISLLIIFMDNKMLSILSPNDLFFYTIGNEFNMDNIIF